MPPTVLVLGSLNIDYTAVVDRLPSPGETVLGGELLVTQGGKGANQAVASARSGAVVSLLGCVGRDDGGRIYLDKLATERVDTSLLRLCEEVPTGTALIYVERGSGENMIAVCPGANSLLSPDDVESARERIAAAGVVVAQLESPMETVIAAGRICREVNTPFLLNPSPVPPGGVPPELLVEVDYLVCNQTEMGLLADGLAGGSLRDAADLLLTRGMAAVVMTLGSEGCAVVEKTGVSRVSSFPVRPVDAVGAGDAFTGALATGLAEGRPLQEAARFASAAGALAVTTAGAMPSLPNRHQIESLLEQQSAG